MRFLQLLCLAGAFACASSADNIVFDNTGQSSPLPQADPIMINQGISPIYDSFATGGAGQITSLHLALSLCVNGGNPCYTTDFTSGSFQVGLYADNPGGTGNPHMPGAEITQLATVSDSMLSATPAIYTIPLAALPSLSANTTYWIGVSGTTTDAQWSWTTGGGGTGVAVEFFDNPVGLNPNTCGLATADCGPYLMSVTTAGATTAQTITFAPLSNVSPGAAPFGVSATASSGLAVSFASNTPSVCTVSGSTITILISGGCSITATQAGNATYMPAPPVTEAFTVLFNDVSPSAGYATAVDLFAQYGITAGCGNDDYCPNEDVTRDQMAIFLVRAIYGTDSFTSSATPYFTDVQPTTFGFKWIQKLYELGITKGCTPTTYCPNEAVSRDDMAIFLITLRYGMGLAAKPPSFSYSTTPYFTDVIATNFAFPWVQRMKQDGITAGCGNGDYCPTVAVNRADMAIFILAAAFNQLLPPGTPVIAGISPSTLGVGTSGTFTITGANTNFVQGTTTIGPIPGVTIGAVTVNSPTSLTVQLTASANATPQPYSVVAITGTEDAPLPSGLMIQ